MYLYARGAIAVESTYYECLHACASVLAALHHTCCTLYALYKHDVHADYMGSRSSYTPLVASLTSL